MGKRKKALVPPPVRSLKRARQLTSAFHKDQGSGSVSRAAYQEASRAATARHRTTARFVFSSLTALGRRPPAGQPRPRLLEIGAVNTQLLACPWLDVRAIDIRPAARGIEALDFFDFPLPSKNENEKLFDVVVCAMVLNCVPDSVDRGAMLARIRAVLRAPGGLAILALPTRCVSGRGCSVAGFEGAMAAAGLGPVLETRAGPKVTFWSVGVLPAGQGRLPYSTGSPAAAGEFAVVVEGGVEARGRGKGCRE
jgi:hypothetical protein